MLKRRTASAGFFSQNGTIKQLHAKIGELTVEKDFLLAVHEKLGKNGGLR
jgi:hypothetical protein